MSQKECTPCKKTSIGGQALIEGIMMRGPQKTAMAVRNPAGEIVLEEWENPVVKRAKIFKLPIIRGAFNFFDSMKTGYHCLMRSAEISFPEEEEEKKDKDGKKKDDSAALGAAVALGSVLGVALAVGLFVFLPSFLATLVLGKNAQVDHPVLVSVLSGVIKVILLVAYMAAVSLMKDIRRVFMYHGAEHKTIFCYEAGLDLTVDNIRPMKRFHPRCGTSFLILMVLVSIVIMIPVSMLLRAWLPAAILGNKLFYTLVRVGLAILLIPLMMGIGYELIKFCGRHDNLLTKIISAPGVWLQHITVFEPDDSMIECAIKAMKQVIPEDEKADQW